MRNTALSRLHARSDSDVPMATMNVTKVVERGELHGGAGGDKHSGEHEIDRAAYEVERGTLFGLSPGGVKTPVDPHSYLARYVALCP